MHTEITIFKTLNRHYFLSDKATKTILLTMSFLCISVYLHTV